MTPVERLVASRIRLAREMRGDAGDTGGSQPPPRPSGSGGWRMGLRVLRTWWSRHPANATARIAQPLIENYAREKPLQLVGIAAGLGAAAVIVKPWRLISVGALLAATLRSSDFSSLLVSLLSQDARQPREDAAHNAAH
jgi:hypothetical protein